jgi:pimeloyl-ACP methyl ester carboxylesterase
MPVLAIGGEASYGGHVAEAMTALADDVQSVVIPGTGHWVAEDAPDAMLAALTPFLAPYRDGSSAAQTRLRDAAAVR